MKKIGINDVKKEVEKMEDILEAVERINAWPYGETSASRQLCNDLCFFTIYLALADKGVNRQRLNFINEVLGYNFNIGDVRKIIEGIEYQNDNDYCSVFLSGISSVIIDASDAEDELRSRGMDYSYCIPNEIAKIFGIVGKVFMGNEPSKKEMEAYGMYMMNINMFLAEGGYFRD